MEKTGLLYEYMWDQPWLDWYVVIFNIIIDDQ